MNNAVAPAAKQNPRREENAMCAKDASQQVSAIGQELAGKYLTFGLADEEYGLEILRVREIIGMMNVTPIPRTPDFVLGVINLRGKVIPVVDLRLKFALQYKEPDDRTCVIVVEVMSEDQPIMMGIVVDMVNEVADVRAENVEPTPSFGVVLDTSFILGMAKFGEKVITLLAIDKVLTSTEIRAIGSI